MAANRLAERKINQGAVPMLLRLSCSYRASILQKSTHRADNNIFAAISQARIPLPPLGITAPAVTTPQLPRIARLQQECRVNSSSSLNFA
jgi:hypothetical protein